MIISLLSTYAFITSNNYNLWPSKINNKKIFAVCHNQELQNLSPAKILYPQETLQSKHLSLLWIFSNNCLQIWGPASDMKSTNFLVFGVLLSMMFFLNPTLFY